MAQLRVPTMSIRSTQEVFEDHLRKRVEDNFEGDLKLNYAPDLVMLTCSGIFRGYEGLRQSHQVLMKALPAAKIECFNKLIDREFAFLEWSAKTDSVELTEGADSFVIREGKIRFQSIHYKVHPLERSGTSCRRSEGVQLRRS
jgi:hypothetical protein